MPYSDPEKAKNYQRGYRRLRRAGDTCTTPVRPVIPPDLRLKTADDVLELLRSQLQAVLVATDCTTLERARTIGYLATITLKAIEVGDVAARVEAVEAILKQRKDGEAA